MERESSNRAVSVPKVIFAAVLAGVACFSGGYEVGEGAVVGVSTASAQRCLEVPANATPEQLARVDAQGCYHPPPVDRCHGRARAGVGERGRCGCQAGLRAVRGICCWPDQGLTARGECVGTPSECPSGLVATPTGCSARPATTTTTTTTTRPAGNMTTGSSTRGLTFHAGGGPLNTQGQGGGPMDVSTVSGVPDGCIGWIRGEAPFSLRVPNVVSELQIRADSEGSDPTLVIRSADGTYYCNDDTNGQQPQVNIHNAQGDYVIWIGRFSSGPVFPVALSMEEGSGVDAFRFAGSAVQRRGTTQGEFDVSTLDTPGCGGFVRDLALHEVTLDQDMEGVQFSVQANVDTTLIVRDDDGNMRCSDDRLGMNPVVEGAFYRGTYNVWIGTKQSGQAANYELVVSRRPTQFPQTCGADASVGLAMIGATVRLGRHREVGGNANWNSNMERWVGRATRITDFPPPDRSGCAVVRVEADEGEYFWRVRDLTPLSFPPEG